jgi:hypothetical protein
VNERWEALGRGQRIAIVVVAGLLLLGLLGDTYSSLVGSTPGGPASSSRSTGGSGLSAWAELIERRGGVVVAEGEDLADLELPADATAVLADPGDLDARATDALRGFVSGGGRLVLLGDSTAAVIGSLTGDEPGREGGRGPVRPWVAVPELDAVERIEGDGAARWAGSGGLAAVAGGPDGSPFLLVGDVGEGRVVALPTADVVSNRLLDEGDNAALALSLVGPLDRPVVFLDAVHEAAGGGLDALPETARAVGLGVLVALGVAVWAVAGRFGPPEPQERQLRPARLDHVDAVAADLDRVVLADAQLVEGLAASPSLPVTDLAAALEVGAEAAGLQRARRGVATIATVPAEPTSRGADP